MKFNILMPALILSSLSLVGCQQNEAQPAPDNDKKAQSVAIDDAKLDTKAEADSTDEAKPTKLTAQDVTFKKIPFDYKLPKNVADNCVDSDTYMEGEVSCPSVDISLAQVEPKWIEDVINLAITNDNNSEYIKFKRGLDDFVQGQIKDESPLAYSQTVEPEQLAPHKNVAQFSILSDVYLGGAHGMPNLSYYIFDMDLQSQIGLENVIDDADFKFHDLLRTEFINYLADEMDIVTPEQVAEYEETWPFTISDEFYFGKKGLVLVYQPYQLGSFAQGFIELTIPYSKLDGVIRAEYL